ncbi:MAG: zinc-ribbon domain-containing protein [Alphaproteobacteria bacterium]|nr:zinc-ribbon domain-containing protein [Alphaproteobacteria bacterium]
MILTCPSCTSRYHVDAAAFQQKPRKVRCANCGHRWKAEPPVDEPKAADLELAPPPATRPKEQVRAAAAAAPKRRRRSSSIAHDKSSPSRVGWLLGVGVVVLLLVSAVIGRNGIVGKFPATAAVYQSVGLTVDQDFGLEFKDVTLDWQREGGAFVLVVEGEIVNLSQANQVIPPVRMAILDGDGRELQHEYFELEESELSAGNRINFSGRLVDPIDQGENFRLTFGQES